MKLGCIGIAVSILMFLTAVAMRSFGPSLEWRMDDQLFLCVMAYIIGMPSLGRLAYFMLRYQDNVIAKELDGLIRLTRRFR